MLRILKRTWTAVFLGLLIGASASADAAERSAQAILAELNAIRFPPVDQSRLPDPGYRASVEQSLKQAAAVRDALILELFQADPNNDNLPLLMQERWRRIPPVGPNEAKLKKELSDVLARSQNDQLKTEAYFARAQAGLFKSQQTGILDLAGVDEFLQKAPKDARGALLLYMGTVVAREEPAKEALRERILKDYPDSQATTAIRAERRQRDGLGQSFEMDFTDTISGSKVSMKGLKGKVVVVDFWATWCSPCVAEMPHMKQLYSKYHGQGLEFIGVNLDEEGPGGLDRVKKFVQQHDIPWPQFFLGKPGPREFAESWGVKVLPTVFVVDAEGKLYSVQPGTELDKMIPDLLARKGNAAKLPAGGR